MSPQLQSNLPADKRRPGTYHYFDDTSGAGALVPTSHSVALIGIRTSAGTATVNVPVQVYNEAEAATYFGVGSELALMCNMAFATIRKRNAFAQVWAVPIAAPVNAAATRTFTFSGTATENGDGIVRIAGRTIRGPVKLGDSSATVAAALKAAIDAKASDLPVTAGVAGSVVTTTHRSHGVNGNDVLCEVVSMPGGITCVAATGVAGAGVSDIQPALDVMGTRDYLAVAIANHLAQDLTDLGEHGDLMWAAARKRYRHMFVAERGTLGTATTLAAAQNRKDIIVVAFEGARNTCGEIAAAVAAMTQTKERPSYNWDKTELPLYGAADALVFEDAEVETALLGGVTPLTLTDTGAVQVERLVTTKATQGGVTFENLRDYSVSATMAYAARQIDAKFAPALLGQNADAEFLKSLHDMGYRVLKRMEELGDLHHVDDHAAELVVAAHPDIPSRILVEIPESVVPNAHQIDATHRLFVEAA